MQIAVASGKGGTGKTTVAVGLALSLAGRRPVQLLDCDVEAPNAHLFLNVHWRATHTVESRRPRIDPNLCRLSGECVKVCEYGALAIAGGKVLVFDDLCHGCGLCSMVCPNKAIHEIPVPLGVVEVGDGPGFPFARGVLKVGESTATPIVHRVKREADPDRLVILDCPPGTGCPTIASMRGADYALLVTEPTPFGLHDLMAAVGMARAVGVPVGVVLNRDGIGDGAVADYCAREGLPLLDRIPFDRSVAAAYAEGKSPAQTDPAFRRRMVALADGILEVAR